ncbi:MAG: polysaccharide lyase [Bacteroidota bacterium]
MRMPSKLAIVFNGAALLVVAVSGAVVLRSLFISEEIPACSQRYQNTTQLSLERPSGEPLTPADLQARFGGTDWGLLENASVVARRDSPAGRAIEVRLAKATAEAEPRSGMGFRWQPRLLGKTASACLTYSVFLPQDFDFGKSGRLPGLMGLADQQSSGDAAFSTSNGWRDGGALDVYAQLPREEGHWIAAGRGKFQLPRGRWVALEQEVILNTPGQADGVLRSWADGKLNFERTGLAFQDHAGATTFGALIETSAGAGAGSTAAKPQKLWLSPVELRWQ